MSDSYLDFANSALGSRIAAMLGLPQPVPLERYRADQPVIKGSVLIGTGGNPELLPALSTALHALGATSVAHRSAPQWVALANQAGMMTGRWGVEDKPGEKVKALVFDATGLQDSTQSDALYQFFHDAARSVLPCGRVVVIGRTPETCAAPRKATVQRALEGLTRSLGKELKRGITAQLVYVAPGAEEQLESTLRSLLSPRSAYVSAQVVRIGLPVGPAQAPTDWCRPLEGKKVLVTGASRGIGAAIAEVMARDGAQLICLDVPQAQAGLDEVAARLGGKPLALDIGAPEAPAALVAAAQAVRSPGLSAPALARPPRSHFARRPATPPPGGSAAWRFLLHPSRRLCCITRRLSPHLAFAGTKELPPCPNSSPTVPSPPPKWRALQPCSKNRSRTQTCVPVK